MISLQFPRSTYVVPTFLVGGIIGSGIGDWIADEDERHTLQGYIVKTAEEGEAENSYLWTDPNGTRAIITAGPTELITTEADIERDRSIDPPPDMHGIGKTYFMTEDLAVYSGWSLSKPSVAQLRRGDKINAIGKLLETEWLLIGRIGNKSQTAMGYVPADRANATGEAPDQLYLSSRRGTPTDPHAEVTRVTVTIPCRSIAYTFANEAGEKLAAARVDACRSPEGGWVQVGQITKLTDNSNPGRSQSVAMNEQLR